MERHLLIAPSSDLEYQAAEVQEILNSVSRRGDVTLLIDAVNLRNTIAALGKHRWTGVWFVGHTGEDGLVLDNGETMTASHLVQTLRGRGPALFVFNSCSTAQVAARVHSELQSAALGTIAVVQDRNAYVTMARFASVYGGGADVAVAYEAAKPDANTEYILFNGRVRMNGDNGQADVTRLLLQVMQQLGEMKDEIQSIRNRLNKKPKYAQMQRVAFVVGMLFFYVPILLLFEEFRRTAELNWVASVIILWTSWTGGAVLWAYAIGILQED